MPSATRVIVLKRRVWVALRPGFVAAAMLLALAPQGASAAPLDLFSISPAAPFTSEQVTFASTYNERHRIADMGPRRRPVLRRRHGPDGPMVLLAGRRIRGHALHQRRGPATPPPRRGSRCRTGRRQRSITYAPLSPKSGDSVIAGLDVRRPRRAARVSGVGPRRRRGVRRLVGADRLGHLLGCGEPPDRAAGYGPRRSRERNRGHDRGAGTAGARTESLPGRADRGELRHPWDQDRAARDHGPNGARIEIQCRGRGCPFKKLVRKARPQTVRVRRFARRILRPGAVVQVWVTRPGEIGKYTRLRIRKGMRPTRVDRCLMPGSKRPAPCPS